MRGDTRVDKSDTKDYGAQARNQLGAPGGAEFSERSPNFLNYVQHIFLGSAKNILGVLRPYVTGLAKPPKAWGP